MWNEVEGMWRDYVIKEHLDSEGVTDQRSPGQGVVSVSSFLPLWSGVLDNEVIPDRAHKKKQVLVSLQSSGLVQVRPPAAGDTVRSDSSSSPSSLPYLG